MSDFDKKNFTKAEKYVVYSIHDLNTDLYYLSTIVLSLYCVLSVTQFKILFFYFKKLQSNYGIKLHLILLLLISKLSESDMNWVQDNILKNYSFIRNIYRENFIFPNTFDKWLSIYHAYCVQLFLFLMNFVDDNYVCSFKSLKDNEILLEVRF
jgi:hypothetical protein